MTKHTTVFIVDDDDSVRDSLCWLVESVGLKAQSYESAPTFLHAFCQIDARNRSGCLVSDIRMQGMSGLELQLQLRERGIQLPMIFITGYGDVSMAVQAMKAGAVDFFTKPVNDQALIESIQRALSQEIEVAAQRGQLEQIQARLASLTPREREVLGKVADGKLNKVIAAELNVSSKTIEAHRAKVMAKMSAHTVAELVRMVVRVE
ncbi:Two-component transcriptional response regulator, LuxR family [hydrothermal vent metagenome]|uniref:Two-component transcriptional response regulator, LuxR family n=1 Tax=hydrothermal vent metagenome TaxID=652676 RepID=A0A3B0YYC7_9ZZZZ